MAKRHYADQRISLDLDDGVKMNYGKFGKCCCTQCQNKATVADPILAGGEGGNGWGRVSNRRYRSSRSIAAIISDRCASADATGFPRMLLSTAVISAVESR